LTIPNFYLKKSFKLLHILLKSYILIIIRNKLFPTKNAIIG